jgi:hypothetical protein
MLVISMSILYLLKLANRSPGVAEGCACDVVSRPLNERSCDTNNHMALRRD